MRAMLIDPEEQTFEEVDWNGSCQHAYELLKCELVEILKPMGRPFVLYVDERGKLHRPRPAKFYVDGLPVWVYGRALAVGRPDRNGDDTPFTYDEEFLANFVNWP